MSESPGTPTRPRETTRSAVARRPPAIEPIRIGPQLLPSSEQLAAVASPATTTDLPPVVLRIPDVHRTDVSSSSSVEALVKPPGKEKTKLFAIAMGLVLLAAFFFSGRSQSPSGPARNSETEPAPTQSPTGEAPRFQSTTAWQEAVVPLPPVERYPDYRSADRGASLADQARRESLAPSRPAVRLEGRIEMQPLGTSYDGPRSSPY